jgi:hypothetical protein
LRAGLSFGRPKKEAERDGFRADDADRQNDGLLLSVKLIGKPVPNLQARKHRGLGNWLSRADSKRSNLLLDPPGHAFPGERRQMDLVCA